MPRQGQSVESCVIGAWHKKKGDKVSAGDILFTYETDKSTFEEEAKVDGVLLEVFYNEGDDVECLKTVCLIGNEGEDVGEFGIQNSEFGIEESGGELKVRNLDLGVAESSPGANVVISKEPYAGSGGISGSGDKNTIINSISAVPRTGFIPVSPRARALASKTGADLNRVVPTGADGRIIEKDVIKAIADGYHMTPAARVSATSENQLDITRSLPPDSGVGVTGTGIGGRFTVDDINTRQRIESTVDSAIPASAGLQLTAAAFQPITKNSETEAGTTGDATDYEEIKIRGVRKVIAKAMHASLSEGAQLTLHSSFDATDILSFKKNLKSLETRNENNAAPVPNPLAKITITDIITYAVSRVLPKHRNINAHFLGESMKQFNNAHIGVAVDTPRGLLVPTLFNANTLNLAELSASAKSLFEKCRQGTIGPDALRGGTFTISNLGGMGIEMFTPILNPPQTGILGVCCIVERTKEGKAYPAMGLSLTFDHRALDGADAARFLKELIAYLEEFSVMLAIGGI